MSLKKEEAKTQIPAPEAKPLLSETEDTPSSDSLAQLFLPKKFAFKPTGAPSVSHVIKKVGLYNEDEEEEAPIAAV